MTNPPPFNHAALEAERQYLARTAATYATRVGLLTAEEQATLLDIVRQYHAGDQPASVTMAWIYGLIANSSLNNGSL